MKNNIVNDRKSEIREEFENFFAKINLYSNSNNFNNKNDQDVIEYIHQNLDEIENNIDIANKIMPKIITHEKIIKECLLFDLFNYKTSNKIKDISNCIEFFNKILKKFQYKIGGYNIEDPEWILANDKTTKIKNIKKGQYLLYNTTSISNNDKDLEWFIDNIYEYLSRNISQEHISIKYRIFEQSNICWIVFIFQKKN